MDLVEFEQKTKNYSKESKLLDRVCELERKLEAQQKINESLRADIIKIVKKQTLFDKMNKEKFITKSNFIGTLDEFFWDSDTVQNFMRNYSLNVSKLEAINEQVDIKDIMSKILIRLGDDKCSTN